MSTPIFNARITPQSSAVVNATEFDCNCDIFDGTGTFSGLDVAVNNIVYLDTFNSITAPNTVSKYQVTQVYTRAVGTVFVKLKYVDTGDVVDPGEVTGNPGFICAPSAVNALAFHAAPTIHSFPSYITEFARDKEGFEKIDPQLQGNWQVIEHTLTGTDITNKAFIISPSPLVPSEVTVDIVGAPPQDDGVDYQISASTFMWSGLGLDGVLGVDDVVRLSYFA